MEKETQNTTNGENKQTQPEVDITQLESQLKEKEDKIRELEIEIDKARAEGRNSDEELSKVSALRKERRRIEEQIENKKSEIEKYNEILSQRKREAFKIVVSKQLQEVGITNPEKVDDVVDRLIANDVDINDTKTIEEKIKQIVPAVDVEGYWEARKKLAELSQKTTNEVEANISSATPDSGESDTGEEYTAEELKYAQEQGITPDKAREILNRFSANKRRLE